MSCCGKLRRSLAPTSPLSRLTDRGPARPARSGVGSIERGGVATGSSSRRRPGSVVRYRYVGESRLIVEGPMTGRRYFFEHPGAELVVDSRDAESLVRVPVLRRT